MTPINWPAGVPQFLSSWDEQTQPGAVRTPMDNSAVKVRKRYTGVITHADCSIITTQAKAQTIKQFFEVDCQMGVKPFWFTHPMTGATVDYRMMEAPAISNLGPLGATVRMRWEHLPYWG